MKKIFAYILLSLIGITNLMAQVELDMDMASARCEQIRKNMKYPYYYCDCWEKTNTFHFGLDTVIADTTWFNASIDNLKSGLSAYWFADCSVTMEVYAFCTSKEPTLVLTVGGNQMREVDVAYINSKVEQMENMGTLLNQILEPSIRVFTNSSDCKGRVMCYPYEQGPHSTCDDALSIVNGMTYVHSHAYDVYRLDQSLWRQKLSMQWKQKNGKPCTVWVTKDSCDGELLIAPTTMRDSLHFLYPDSAMIRNSYSKTGDGHDLYFHIESDSAAAGRIKFNLYTKILRDTVDSVLCHGKRFELGDTILTETTQYSDTLWLAHDTVVATTYNLEFTPAEAQPDTLWLKTTDFPYTYRQQHFLREFGPHLLGITHMNGCDELYQLQVEHLVSTTSMVIDTTLCEGKSFTLGSHTYTTSQEIEDTTWLDADTRAIVNATIRFTEPDTLYDTIRVTAAELNTGILYNGQYIYKGNFGERILVITRKNTCTYVVKLMIVEVIVTDWKQTTEDSKPKSKKIVIDGQIYIQRGDELYDILGNKK